MKIKVNDKKFFFRKKKIWYEIYKNREFNGVKLTTREWYLIKNKKGWYSLIKWFKVLRFDNMKKLKRYLIK